MPDSGADRGSDRLPPPAATPEPDLNEAEAAKLAELRALFAGPDRRDAVDVRAQVAHRQARTLEVSEVLPDAIAQGANDPQLARALTPAVEHAIRLSARRDPRLLVDALLPVMGRTLRKSIAQALTPLITIGCAALLVGGVWAYQAFRARQDWNDYLHRLVAEPGIVVIQEGRRNGKFFVTGLRDELAANPATLLAASRVPPDSVESRWELYQALHPNFVLQRARDLLRPPAGVTLGYRDGVLTAAGAASADWVSESRHLAPALAGVRRFEFAGTVPDTVETPSIASVPEGPEPPSPQATNATPPSPPSTPGAAPSPPSTTGAAPSAPSATAAPPPPQPTTETAPAPPPPPTTEARVIPAPPRPLGPERQLMEQIEVSTLVFSPTHRDLAPGQDATARRLATLLGELNEMLHARGARARVELVANISELSTVADTNLATTRLNAALALFRTQKFDSLVLTAITEASASSSLNASGNADRDWSRRVSLRVRLLPRP